MCILYDVLDQITAQLSMQKIKKKMNVKTYFVCISYCMVPLYCERNEVLEKALEAVVICKWV